MTNRKSALQLVDQMIERAREEDRQKGWRLIKENKASKTVGDSWMVFHLKALRGLIEDGDEWYTM